MKRQLLATALIAGIATHGLAADITTAQMGTVMSGLPNVPCRDLQQVIETKGLNSAQDTMTLLALIGFIKGYHHGAGISEDAAMRRIVNLCIASPDLSLTQAIARGN